MFKVITPSQMHQLEQRAFSNGIESLDLMERAAECVAEHLLKLVGGADGKKVAFFCGRGNNGGDGLAAARLFQKAGGASFVIMKQTPHTGDSLSNFRRIKELDIPVFDVLPQNISFDGAVDALIGIGLEGSLKEEVKKTIALINSLSVKILSIDIPSGINALTGTCVDGCVKADITITFQYSKPGHFLAGEPDPIGELAVSDIGLLDFSNHLDLMESLQCEDLSDRLPKRSKSAHKGSHGRVLLYCGSRGMAGAAAMAALGCMRAGAGLTYIACDESIRAILQILAPNAQCLSVEKVLAGEVKFDVLLAGCGLGQEQAVWQNIKKIYSREVPTVLDADALNLLAKDPINLSKLTIITPHVGEAARLLWMNPKDVSADMLSASAALAEKYQAVVLLKSFCSVIQDKSSISLNALTAPILAKGGSGDALAGIAAGLLAQGLAPYEAARLASLWLSKSALLTQQNEGFYSPLTGDILGMMGKASL